MTLRNLVVWTCSILHPLIKIPSDVSISCSWSTYHVRCFFSIFKDSLFAFSHANTTISSIFTVLIKEGRFFPVQKKLESSANYMAKSLGDARARSFIYNKNNKGPKLDPWGTPHWTLSELELVWLNSTNWCLSVRQLESSCVPYVWYHKTVVFSNRMLWSNA